jgi:hypothetical protein
MVHKACVDVFGQQQALPDVNDDLWHHKHRITKHIPIATLTSDPSLSKSLKTVYNLVYRAAEGRDILPTLDAAATSISQHHVATASGTLTVPAQPLSTQATAQQAPDTALVSQPANVHRVVVSIPLHNPSVGAIATLDPGSRDADATGNLWANSFKHALQVWLLEHSSKLPPAAVAAAEEGKRKAQYLFKFFKHNSKLLRFGTTANESVNKVLNRRMQCITHIRPDHAQLFAVYSAYLWNCNMKAKALESAPLTDAQKDILKQLFCKPALMPLHRSRSCAPYIMTMQPAARVYTMEEFAAEFGDLADGDDSADPADSDTEVSEHEVNQEGEAGYDAMEME